MQHLFTFTFILRFLYVSRSQCLHWASRHRGETCWRIGVTMECGRWQISAGLGRMMVPLRWLLDSGAPKCHWSARHRGPSALWQADVYHRVAFFFPIPHSITLLPGSINHNFVHSDLLKCHCSRTAVPNLYLLNVISSITWTLSGNALATSSTPLEVLHWFLNISVLIQQLGLPFIMHLCQC